MSDAVTLSSVLEACHDIEHIDKQSMLDYLVEVIMMNWTQNVITKQHKHPQENCFNFVNMLVQFSLQSIGCIGEISLLVDNPILHHFLEGCIRHISSITARSLEKKAEEKLDIQL